MKVTQQSIERTRTNTAYADYKSAYDVAYKRAYDITNDAYTAWKTACEDLKTTDMYIKAKTYAAIDMKLGKKLNKERFLELTKAETLKIAKQWIRPLRALGFLLKRQEVKYWLGD